MDIDEVFFPALEDSSEFIQGHGPKPPDYLVDTLTNISIGVLAFLIPLTIVTNILIFWGIVLYPGFYNSNNIFLLSLSVFDFLVGAVAIPFILLGKFDTTSSYMSGRKYLCLFKSVSIGFSADGSLYSLLVISIDRYLAIMYPLKYRNWVTAERAYKVVFGLWAYIAFRAAIPVLGVNNYDYSMPLKLRCMLTIVHKDYYINYMVTYPGQACLIISTLINIHIAYVVRKQIKSFKSERSVWTSEQIKSFDARISSVKITLALTVLFIILWIPFYIVLPLRSYQVLTKRQEKILRTISSMCTMSNSMVNAPIYAAIRNEYRDVYKLMLTVGPCRWKQELRKLHQVRNSSFAFSSKSEEKSSSKEKELSYAADVHYVPTQEQQQQQQPTAVAVESESTTVARNSISGVDPKPRLQAADEVSIGGQKKASLGLESLDPRVVLKNEDEVSKISSGTLASSVFMRDWDRKT